MENCEIIAKFIEKESGICFSEHNLYQLKTRIEDWIKLGLISNIPDLITKINTNNIPYNIKQQLIDSATNNETLFFRDPVFFQSIEDYLIEYVKREKPKELKFWSAASSTGQEAISLCIMLTELSEKIIGFPKFSIIGTDICSKALNKACSGNYTLFEISRGLSEERKQKYFYKSDDSWTVKNVILDKIKYSNNNLLKSSISERFDLILCRNILIYQKIENKELIVSRLRENLNPNGLLLLGVGETLIGINTKLTAVKHGKVVFYQNSINELKIA